MPDQSYDLGNGSVTMGTKILYLQPGERATAGIVTDLTQDGDVTIKLDRGPSWDITTKWRYVIPFTKGFI